VEKLSALLEEVWALEVLGPVDPDVEAVTLDSRSVRTGSLFAALRGTTADGHRFIGQAVANGATAVICEDIPALPDPNCTYVKVADSSEAFGRLAARFYGHPSRELKLVGVTGTNGKTTTATLLYELFLSLGYKVGLLSTIENKVNRFTIASTHTTPDAGAVNLLIRQMVEAGCDYAFMEVSSHAAVQRRIAGLCFAGGIFTNITHDHLDYHKTFQAYIQAKKMFFDMLPKDAFALVNGDDKRGSVMLQNTAARTYSYALLRPADFKGRLLENNLSGLVLDIDGETIHARLVGDFNAYNLLAAYAAARLLGQHKSEVLPALSGLKAAAGRFDCVADPSGQVTAVVDYAHTPDALEKVLATLHRTRKGGGRILTVVGCGGDRDRSKRPLMAKVAADYSDLVLLTSDNPRSESPESILAEMEAGVPPYARHRKLSILHRAEAIRTACQLARSGDVILVAGKGHEKYQEIMGVRYPFDDLAILRETLRGIAPPTGLDKS
jgi:UDP-N-acetylmuramoyl-L-alanyl-D-glutamate--2,6-diaminopimelate ligase